MGHDWPGREAASSAPLAQKPLTVEAALREDVGREVDGDAAVRFLPYVQMHEFEALLFARPSAIAEAMRNASKATDLDAIRAAFANPEEINDSANTAPSKRIESLFPSYQKPFHGVVAAQRITIEVMLGACPHFRDWVATLAAI